MNHFPRSALACALAFALATAALATSACSPAPDPADAVAPDASDLPEDAAADAPADGLDVASPDARDLPHADPSEVPPADAAADPSPETDPGTTLPPLLTPDEIGFESLEPTWGGSVIYFSTWSQTGGKDEIWMMRPEDPAGRTIRMKAGRVWAFGVAPDGTIAFSGADPKKATNYPDLANLYDAIQYTWLLRPGQAPVQVSNGRINDECHVFLPDGKTLLLCRRANFSWLSEYIQNDPYRVVRLDLETLTDTFLTPLNPMIHDNNAYPRDDGTLLFTRIYADTNEASLWTMNADGSNPLLALEGASRAVISADGTKAWFKKAGSNDTWMADSHQLGAATVVDIGQGQAAEGIVPSPDGTRVAFEVHDASANCTDLYVSKADGSEQTLLVDCSQAGLYIAGVRWAQTDGLPLPDATPELAPEPVPEPQPEPDPDPAPDPAPEISPEIIES